MKEVVKIFGILLLCMFFKACSNDKEEEILGNNDDSCKEEVSYEKTVKPLIINNCATSGCHEAGETDPELTSYSKIEKNSKDIDKEIKGGDMPPDDSGFTLSEEEKQAIYCWIEQGAQKN